MTLAEHVAAAALRLRAAGVPPEVVGPEAAVLARHVLGWDRAAYLCRLGSPAPAAFGGRYAAAVDRRAGREPVSSIVGEREFRGLRFEVGPAVLTPRPETELLVEETLRLAAGRNRRALHIVDAGTGSGCVAVALAAALPASRITATDISAAALQVARRNARRHGVHGRIGWVQTSWLAGLAGAPDVIAANPPYIRGDDLARLPPEVRKFEPRIALAGGADGLEAVRALLRAAAERLPPGGYLVLEVGAGQAAAACAAAVRCPGLSVAGVRRDLQGIERIVTIQRAHAAGKP